MCFVKSISLFTVVSSILVILMAQMTSSAPQFFGLGSLLGWGPHHHDYHHHDHHHHIDDHHHHFDDHYHHDHHYDGFHGHGHGHGYEHGYGHGYGHFR